MPVYVVCRKKRNNPRMDVRICELKCDLREECNEFKTRQCSAPLPKQGTSTSADHPRVELEAA